MARKKKFKPPIAKVIGDPNTNYEPTENHQGPGRMPASYGFGHDRWPDRFRFQCRYPHDAKPGEGRLYTVSWGEAYAAKVFLDYLTGGKDPKWKTMSCFVTSSGVEVRCEVSDDRTVENDLEEAMNYEPTRAERAFKLPEQQRKAIAMLTRPWPDISQPAPRGQAKVERGIAARRPDGEFVSVQDICEDLGMEAREGRAALRKAKIDKPSWGWSFVAGSDELIAARKAIAKGKR